MEPLKTAFDLSSLAEHPDGWRLVCFSLGKERTRPERRWRIGFAGVRNKQRADRALGWKASRFGRVLYTIERSGGSWRVYDEQHSEPGQIRSEPGDLGGAGGHRSLTRGGGR